jgi:poly(3-hydroxybutyrate) depolymerase
MANIRWKPMLVLLGVAASLVPLSSRAETISLSSLADLDIDEASISLSGISSGAFMAHQFHVIHSRNVMGVGIIAGGPYRCAEGRYFWSWFDATGLHTATSVCSNTNPFWFFQGPPDVQFSINSTREQAKAKTIDDPINLGEDRVWLFSGANDDVAPEAVMDTVETYYETFMDSDNITYAKDDEANHAMITAEFGNACDAFESPFINDCDFDAAEGLMRHIYGELHPKAAADALQPVVAFDQTEFFDADDKSTSLNGVGFVYIPRACADGARCRLHVAFHGCQQHQEAIGDLFFTQSAYNEWAETNRTVVLYPQTVAWKEGFFARFRQNPMGCWDWWGYSGDDFAEKSGKQVSAVARMINTLVGKPLLAAPNP